MSLIILLSSRLRIPISCF
uniref:Uncharacterized protein n=1 Tax=Anguilla anguilla TaxID=7936 RepID=A0A0E9SUZ2_ANGAN